MENRLLLVGAIGAFFLPVSATLVSDMHGVGDWYIASLQTKEYPLNPASIYGARYWLAGYIGEPLLILSIALFTVGFYGSWLKYHKPISLLVVGVGVLYMLERVFWSYATVNFQRAIQVWPVIQDYSVLTQAGQIKGMAALLGGLIGGFAFSIVITIFYFSVHNRYGQIGGLMVIITMLIGMPAKILFASHVETWLLTVFMTSMVLKNFGIAFMGMGLLTEALKPLSQDESVPKKRWQPTPLRGGVELDH